MGTEWEDPANELRSAAEAKSDDRLELYDVGGRGVGVAWPDRGMGHAWVWDSGRWGYARELVNKSWLEGRHLPAHRFALEFPEADLWMLGLLASGALSLEGDNGALLTAGRVATDDDEFVAAGYHLTKLLLRQRPEKFEETANRVITSLEVEPERALPFIASWYSVAHMEVGEPPQTDSPWTAFNKLPDLLAWLSRDRSTGFDDFMTELPLAVGRWADQRCRELAVEAKEQLSQMPPSGIFDRADHASLWDEYCLQVQAGPDELETGWDLTIKQVIDPLIEALSRPAAALLTLSRFWLDDRFEDPLDHETIVEEEVSEGVIEQLDHLAREVEQDWVTG
jgi:hypothetical protein